MVMNMKKHVNMNKIKKTLTSNLSEITMTTLLIQIPHG